MTETKGPLEERLTAEALRCGAAKAVMIPGEKIALLSEARSLCEGNACGHYGRCWTCPPDIGDINTLTAELARWPRGLLYQSISPLEDSFDIEGMQAGAREHALLGARLGRAARALLPEGFLHLGCGGCHLCEACTRPEGLPCRYPDLALPALEGYGVDVYRTCRGTPLAYTNGPNTVTWFGLLLFGA